jgi:hypothetical protein
METAMVAAMETAMEAMMEVVTEGAWVAQVEEATLEAEKAAP